jgi:hypothetical protein
LPRRYHRPPAVKRRKTRRPDSPAPYEVPEDTDGGVSTDLSTDNLLDDTWDEADEVEDSASDVGVTAAAAEVSPRDSVRHVQRDYGYVRSELIRIAVLAAVIIVALMVIAVLR